MIELKVKEFKNVNPESLYLEPLIKVVNDFYKLNISEIWGCVFLSEEKDYSYFYDYKIINSNMSREVFIYVVEDGLTFYDRYVSFSIFKTKEKNKKYKNLNSSEYLEKNEFTNLQ